MADKSKRPNAGTKQKVVSDLLRYVEHPDEPMVPERLQAALAETMPRMDISPNKMYEDGGHKVNAIRYLAARAAVTRPPVFPGDVYRFLEAFFSWCAEYQIPITLGGFALWCGSTQQNISRIEKDTKDPARAAAYASAKECIRVYLEMSAFSNNLNPVLWFHTHAVSFGMVQQQNVSVSIEDNTSELSPEAFRETVDALTLHENADGSYGPD